MLLMGECMSSKSIKSTDSKSKLAINTIPDLPSSLVNNQKIESTPMQDQQTPNGKARSGNSLSVSSPVDGPSSGRQTSGQKPSGDKPSGDKPSVSSNVGIGADTGLVPTPTINQDLPFCLQTIQTLTQALDYAAQGETGYNFYALKGKLKEILTYSDLRDRSRALATYLTDRFERGSRICLVAETSADFIVTFFACQYSGMIPAPMPMPVNLGGKNGYILQLKQMLRGAGAQVAIGPENLSDFMQEAAQEVSGEVSGVEVITYETLKTVEVEGVEPVAFGPDEGCYIQYSSGSTSAPKGVIGTQKSVTSNLHAISNHGLKLTNNDRAASWLPLYHDMGLIGFVLTPLFGQRSVDFIATSDFVRRPLMWLNLISSAKTTITYSPSFGYELAAKRVKPSDKETLELSSIRVAGIGGDMVRSEALNSFSEAFKDVGFDATSFTPSYGLAEATLAIAFSEIEEPVGIDHVDMRHYNRSGIAQPATTLTSEEHKRSFVKCGQVLPDHDLEVRNDQGVVNADREVGRIFIKGPSLTSGYYSDEAASKEMFYGEWLDTGDMGYSLEGNIIITGRAKDLIIINGRNIWPQDIEWAVEDVENVRQGGVAAFSIDIGSGERVVCVVECRGGLSDEERESLRREIAEVIQRAVGAPAEVILVRPHSMVVTSSGKLSRAKVRDKYLQGEFDRVTSNAQTVNSNAL